jgi:hypothetical protein
MERLIESFPGLQEMIDNNKFSNLSQSCINDGRIGIDHLDFNRSARAIVIALRDKGTKNHLFYIAINLQVEDIVYYESWVDVIFVRFRKGIRTTMISKEKVCKKLSPNQFKSVGSKGMGVSSPPLFEESRWSDRITVIEYFSSRDRKVLWTAYIGYSDFQKAKNMKYYLHQEELAWHSVLRTNKRVGAGLEYELKVWSCCPVFLSKLYQLDTNK